MPPSSTATTQTHLVGSSRPRRGLAWLGRILLALVLVLAITLLTARFWVWPQAAQLLNDEVRLMALAEPLLAPHGLRLSVRGAKAEWEDWLAPRLAVEQATLTNLQGRPVLELERAQAVFGLRSLMFYFHELPVFSRLEMERVRIEAGRDAEGHLRLAGFALKDTGDSHPDLFEALSRQGVFRLATLEVLWRDDRRPTQPPLSVGLQDLALRMSASHLAVRAQGVDLHELSAVQQSAWPELTSLRLTGRLAALSLDWSGDLARLPSLSLTEVLRPLELQAHLLAVGLASPDQFSLAGVSGQFRVSDGQGRFQWQEGPVALTMPRLFAEGPLAFDRAHGQLEWAVDDWQPDGRGLPRGLRMDVQNFELENADLLVRGKASQHLLAGEMGPTSIRGSVDRLIPSRAHAYLPTVVGADARRWVQRAFVHARPAHGDFQLEGKLTDFPFDRSKQGRFEARLRVDDLSLNFAPSWPLVERASVDLQFQGAGLKIIGQSAHFGDVPVGRIEAQIADLDAPRPVLTLQAGFDAPLDAMLKTVNNSPVRAMLANFTEGARASGQAALGLDLEVDLQNPDASLVKGQLRFARNRLDLASGIPRLTDLQGSLGFTQQGLSGLQVEGRALGGPLRLSQDDTKAGTRLKAEGQLQGSAVEDWLRSAAGVPLKNALVGQAPYGLTLDLAQGGLSLDVQSSLKGLAIRLPAPARKSAQEDWGLRLHMTQSTATARGRLQKWRLETAANRLTGLLEQTIQSQATGELRASIALGAMAAPPERAGVVLFLTGPSLDLARWLTALDRQFESGPEAGDAQTPRPGLGLVEVRTPELVVGSQRVSSVVARASQAAGVWAIDLQADQVAGRLNWRGAPDGGTGKSKGVLVARLSKLFLAPGDEAASESSPARREGASEDEDPFQPLPVTALSEAGRWPTIDLVAEDFRRGSSRFGQLTLDAAPSPNEAGWVIHQLQVVGPSARLAGSGKWAARAGASQAGKVVKAGSVTSPDSETSLKLDLQISSGEGLLDQMGFGGLIRRTPGKVQGELSWDGAPTDFRPQSLRGQLSLDLSDGQFLKADPGLAKLISVVNLQSLPSRISLDFRDIFSDGFAYQRVRGDVRFERGLAHTSNLRIVGVQATVFIEGEASLPRESQDIRVLVLPELNAGLASLGYALVNPAIGLGSFLAQYVLRDPLRKVLAYEYRVTGPWADPVVAELPRRASPEVSAPR